MPCKQYKLIGKDKLSIAAYVARTLDGVAQNSHLRSDNYFYFNCLTGRCAPQSTFTNAPLLCLLEGVNHNLLVFKRSSRTRTF